MRRLHLSMCLALLAAIFAPGWVFAHGLGVACTLRGNNVEVESFYDDDTPAIKAEVQVVNAEEAVIAQGTTDAKGLWSFPAPGPGKYEVRVNAGAGHRAKDTFVVPAVPSEAPVPEGTDRAELTRTPWLKIFIGLVIIGGCSIAFLIASPWRKRYATW